MIRSRAFKLVSSSDSEAKRLPHFWTTASPLEGQELLGQEVHQAAALVASRRGRGRGPFSVSEVHRTSMRGSKPSWIACWVSETPSHATWTGGVQSAQVPISA